MRSSSAVDRGVREEGKKKREKSTEALIGWLGLVAGTLLLYKYTESRSERVKSIYDRSLPLFSLIAARTFRGRLNGQLALAMRIGERQDDFVRCTKCNWLMLHLRSLVFL